jgi:predicted molibdopterin-dependent oxidoreductase YjgC
LYNTSERVKAALVKNSRGELEPRPLAEAIDIVAEKLAELKTQYGDNSIAGIASSQVDNESLKAFKEFISRTIGSELIDTLDGDIYRTISKGIEDYDSQAGLNLETSLEDILEADCIVVVGANPLESHPVAGSHIARAARQNKATIIVIDPSQNAFTYHAALWLQPEEDKEPMALDILSKAVIDKSAKRDSAQANEIAASLKSINVKKSSEQAGIGTGDLLEAADMLSKAKHSIIIYGQGILRHNNPGLITSLLNLATVASSQDKEKPRIISLKPKGNSRGAWDMGIAHPSRSILKNLARNKVKALYLLLSDDYVATSELPNLSKGLEFIVIQSSYLSSATSKVNVVLPSPIWPEAAREYTTLDGIAKSTSRLVKPPHGIRSDVEILREISKQMNK